MRLLVTLMAAAGLMLAGGCELVSNDRTSETLTVTDDGTLIRVDGNGNTTLVYNAEAAIEEGGAE